MHRLELLVKFTGLKSGCFLKDLPMLVVDAPGANKHSLEMSVLWLSSPRAKNVAQVEGHVALIISSPGAELRPISFAASIRRYSSSSPWLATLGPNGADAA